MLPGFITIYKDKQFITHFYFFPGITDDGEQFYKDVQVDERFGKYKVIEYKDRAKEFIFENKNITGVNCVLIDYVGKSHIRNAVLKPEI